MSSTTKPNNLLNAHVYDYNLDAKYIRALHWAGWIVTYVYDDNKDTDPTETPQTHKIILSNYSPHTEVPDNLIDYLEDLVQKFSEFTSHRSKVYKQINTWDRSTKRKSGKKERSRSRTVRHQYVLIQRLTEADHGQG